MLCLSMSVGEHVRCDCHVCVCLVLMQWLDKKPHARCLFVCLSACALGCLLSHMEGPARRSTWDAMSPMSPACASWIFLGPISLVRMHRSWQLGLVKTHPSFKSLGMETLETWEALKAHSSHPDSSCSSSDLASFSTAPLISNWAGPHRKPE